MNGVTVSGELNYVVEGSSEARVVVLCNALGTDLTMWDAQVATLSAHYRVLRYDHRGQGKSAIVPFEDIGDLSRDVIALLDQEGIASASVCGISLGGMVAMWVASHAPQRVDRLVLCCTSPVMPPREAWEERARRVRADGMGGVAGEVIDRWFTPEFARESPTVIARVRQMLEESPAEGYAACCEAIGRMNLTPDLAAVRAPALIVAGTEDQATPGNRALEMAALMPQARVAAVRSGHMAAIERPGRVTELLLQHLGGWCFS